MSRKVLLDDDPLNLVWLHLAHGRRPANAAGVRVLPALELRSPERYDERFNRRRVTSEASSSRTPPALRR